MDLQLRDKVAVITGGSLGIGLAVAEALAREGARVAMCARDEARVVGEAERIAGQLGAETLGVRADVSRPEDLEHLMAQVERRFGGVDILINNAGTGGDETILDAPDEKWQRFFDLHVMAAVRLARLVQPSMVRRGGGVILHNASICATQPLGYEPIYNVTKAALAMFSKCLANEFIQYNIRVNTVNAGLVLTPDWIKTAKNLTADTGGDWQGHLDQIARDATPIKRFASPEELALFFAFLCSPCASYCVGSSYYVDGGWLRVVN